MKVAIPADEKVLASEVCMSFGRAPYFYIYETTTKMGDFIENAAASSPGGAGVKAAQIVVDSHADILITPRCGENAAEVFKATKLEIYKSTLGSIQNNIDAYMDNKLAVLDQFHAGFHGVGGN
ncbi:MAG: dinitrogenase iron-molybdenum cofactor biosynthesis protein [Acetobacterium sp. MES1]|uniref:NifB/NifX family molybdenum-iron cluster-binding protein n=1 Tax=Acetobacterium sp. MES1 TaxID=1899015 RepID=UPI000B9CDC26|nr:NifB/NifX family molybdenum-iron cluster-binding protein [Acetobacterium sp. MES1]OXS27339.1 MAG: dinitrogenase iron-molybdenum cofactor biosynthesis protein [Acetobacterium sp. MES1]